VYVILSLNAEHRDCIQMLIENDAKIDLKVSSNTTTTRWTWQVVFDVCWCACRIRLASFAGKCWKMRQIG